MTSWQKHFLKLFLGLSAGFALSMILVYAVVSDSSLWPAIPTGLIYGLIMTFFARRRLRKRLEAAGLEPPYRDLNLSPEQRATTESSLAPDQLPERLRQDLNFRFAEMIKQEGNRLSLRTLSNEYSRGERVTLQAEPLGDDRYRYHIHSRPRHRWQLTDTANSLLLVRALQRHLEA